MSYDDMPQKQARIEALREEKGRLQKVRQTIAFYEANAASGKVKKAVLPQMAQQIQPAEGAKYSTNGAGKALDRGLMRWILGGGSILLVLLPFLSWITVAGYDVSFFKMASGIEKLNDFLGAFSTDDVRVMQGICIFICCVMIGIAVVNGIAAYCTLRSGKTGWIYGGTIYGMAAFGVLWLFVLYINMKLKEALGSYGDYIKFKMTFPAWLAVILAIVLCVLNANREKLERSFKGETLSGANAVSGTNQGILPITNYYPWEELQLCTLHMTGHAVRNIWMDYKYVGCAGEVDRKSAQIVADIVFKTTKGVFIIPGISWFISQIQRQGETERKSFQAVPFSAQDVINVESMLRTVEVVGTEKKIICDVSVDSGLDCRELLNYRGLSGRQFAVCKEQELKAGKIDSEGMYCTY